MEFVSWTIHETTLCQISTYFHIAQLAAALQNITKGHNLQKHQKSTIELCCHYCKSTKRLRNAGLF